MHRCDYCGGWHKQFHDNCPNCGGPWTPTRVSQDYVMEPTGSVPADPNFADYMLRMYSQLGIYSINEVREPLGYGRITEYKTN